MDFGRFFEAFRGESDRAAAVLGGAYLDTRLEQLFRARLVPSASNTLFAFRGPLGDFSGKIDLAFALGWLSRECYSDLHLVRRIRNEFAHDVDHTLSFETPSISDRTRNLTALHQIRSIIQVTGMPNVEKVDVDHLHQDLLGTGRKRFEIALAVLEMMLMRAQTKSTQPTEHQDQWEIISVSATLDPGETAAIDLESGTVRKIQKS